MPAGWRTLSAESFGWERISKTVYITEDRIERVELILSAAAFTLSGGKLKKGSVNPRNGGTLGNAEISFEVSGPGGGLLEVLDEGGNTIHTRPLGPFTVRQQRVLWNGKDSGGNPLPDGGYTIRISAWNDEGNTRPLELAARINSLLAMRPLGAASSSGGLFLASAPEALPALSYQIEGSLLGGKPPAEEAWKTLPFAVGFRLAILDTLEAAAAFNAVPAVSGGEAQVLWGAGASVKWILLPPGRGDPSLAAAAELSYAWAGEGPYTAFGMGTGAALRLPLAYRVLESRREGPVLDMILTPFILWAGEEGFPSSPVPRIGLGGGILFSWKQFAGGISLRWDYAPGAAQASGPLVSALELKFLPSSLILSLLAGAWRGEEGAGFFFGTGLGVMY
jgi:hypothetical protein